MRQMYAPSDHPVFELVPPAFGALAAEFYGQIGGPAITRENIWNIYLEVLGRFEHLDNLHRIPAELDVQWGYALEMSGDDYEDNIDLLSNLTPLPENHGAYLGGVNNGQGLGEQNGA